VEVDIRQRQIVISDRGLEELFPENPVLFPARSQASELLGGDSIHVGRG